MKYVTSGRYGPSEEEISYLEIYKLYRDDMAREDELINQRLGWMLLANGIFLTALGYLLGIGEKALQSLVCVCGLGATGFMSVSVWAARRRVIQLDRFVNRLHAELGVPVEFFPRAYKAGLYDKGREMIYWGLVAPLWLPVMLVVVWLCAILIAIGSAASSRLA